MTTTSLDESTYRNHSANIPQLFSWIDELILSTESSLSIRTFPATEELVESVYRYDTVFRELLRQTKLFSENLCSLYAKSWIGVLNLLEYMIKLFHRHVTHTSKLQEDAQKYLSEKQAHIITSKFKLEEAELEQTNLRAKIRNLEAEVQAVLASRESLEKENDQLRSVIEEYMKGKDQFEDIDADMTDTASNSDDVARDCWDPGNTLKSAAEAGATQLRVLNRLDSAMNDVLFNVTREEDRQRVILADLNRLISNNPDAFGGSAALNSALVKAISMRGPPGGTTPTVTVEFKRDIGIQVDEKDKYGVVDDIGPTTVRDVFDDIDIKSPPIKPEAIVQKGLNIPFSLRLKMKKFPEVMRIPSLDWLNQMIMALYMEKLAVDSKLLNNQNPTTAVTSSALAVSPSSKPIKLPLPAFLYQYCVKQYGITAISDIQIVQIIKACEFHKSSKRVQLFSRQLGVADKEAFPELDIRDTDFILSLVKRLRAQLPSSSQEESRKSGLQVYYAHQPVESLGLPNEMERELALSMAKPLFGEWMQGGVEDFTRRTQSLPVSPRGPRYIFVDDFVEVAMEQWQIIRLQWTGHLRFLFKQFTYVYRIVCEATFANDSGGVDKDAILAQITGGDTDDYPRRNARFFRRAENPQRKDKDIMDVSSNASVSSAGGSTLTGPPQASTLTSTNKEPVAELMNSVAFASALRLMDPGLSLSEIEVVYEHAVDLMAQATERSLQQLWVKVDEPDTVGSSIALAQPETAVARRVFYVNMKTGRTQWTAPYKQRTFRSSDIEESAFVSAVLQKNLLAQSPLVEHLHLAPRDLWGNAEMFHRMAGNASSSGKPSTTIGNKPVAGTSSASGGRPLGRVASKRLGASAPP